MTAIRANGGTADLVPGETGEEMVWGRGDAVWGDAEFLGAFAAGDIDTTYKGMSGGKGSASLGGLFVQMAHFDATGRGGQGSERGERGSEDFIDYTAQAA